MLKPLKGVECGSYDNLESFFTQSYPHYELIFSVAHASDPIVKVVDALIAQYPEVQARLIIGAAQNRLTSESNPKVLNLVQSYHEANFDIVLISDSNVRVPTNYLEKLVEYLDPDVGIVTSIVSGYQPRDLGGNLESIYLDTFYSRGMRIAEAFGKACVVGKSMLFRRSVANRFGGVEILSRYLAEDYMAGIAMKNLGYQVAIPFEPVPQYIGRYSFQEFWKRHVRWGRIRKAQAPFAFLLEALLSCFGSGILLAWTFRLHTDPLKIFFLHAAGWLACDFVMVRLSRRGLSANMKKQDIAYYQLIFPLLWILREALALPLWMTVLCGNTVNWRGKRLRVEAGGLLK